MFTHYPCLWILTESISLTVFSVLAKGSEQLSQWKTTEKPRCRWKWKPHDVGNGSPKWTKQAPEGSNTRDKWKAAAAVCRWNKCHLQNRNILTSVSYSVQFLAKYTEMFYNIYILYQNLFMPDLSTLPESRDVRPYIPCNHRRGITAHHIYPVIIEVTVSWWMY